MGHIYTPMAQQKILLLVLEMKAVACFVRTLTGQLVTQMLQAENTQISKQKPQGSRMQKPTAKMKQKKNVILTDSKATLQSLISNTSDQPNSQRWRRATRDYTTPLQTKSTVWQDMSRPLYSDCEQDTIACEHTWSELDSALCDCK